MISGCTYFYCQPRRKKTCIIEAASTRLWGTFHLKAHISMPAYESIVRTFSAGGSRWEDVHQSYWWQVSILQITDQWTARSWQLAERTNKYNTRDMDHFPVQKYLIFDMLLVFWRRNNTKSGLTSSSRVKKYSYTIITNDAIVRHLALSNPSRDGMSSARSSSKLLGGSCCRAWSISCPGCRIDEEGMVRKTFFLKETLTNTYSDASWSSIMMH